MQLDQITANIRLRNPWEAIDLGFALIRHFWRELYLPWFLLLSTVSALIFLLFPAEYQGYAFFGVWWLKPLYDRFLLHILSHKLFNEAFSVPQAFKALPMLIKRTGLFSALTIRRPSLSRGFNIPVWQLEQLRGQQRADRQHILLSGVHSHAIALTLGMIFIESAIYFSFFALIFAFIPQGMVDPGMIGKLMGTDATEEPSLWINILDHVLLTTALFLIEPFYVAASFTLYLNRRTQLEAWDIELAFRQIAKRLETLTNGTKNVKNAMLALLPLLLLLGLSSQPIPLYANSEAASETDTETIAADYVAPERLSSEQIPRVIEQVMQRPELSNVKKSHHWVEIKKDEEKKDATDDQFGFYSGLIKFLKNIGKWLSVVLESSLWGALLIGVLLLIFSHKYWLHLFTRTPGETREHEVPDILFGMDIRPESLPDNIPQAARQLWQKQQHREALSLLYRGALAQLANVDQLALKASQTEGDILTLAQQQLPENRYHYLQRLTEAWMQIAYAHQLPSEEQINTLLDNWDGQWLTHTSEPSTSPTIPTTTQTTERAGRT